jgi:lipoate-protein ligase A
MLFEEIIEIIDPEPHGAALNMAIDETLLNTASTPMLRMYHWAQPSVSFGYFGKFDSVACAWPGREIVRRWTGGGVVPHGEDITYTLIVPKGLPFSRHSARESYRLIHEKIAAHLEGAGRPVAVAAQSSRKVSDACFENPVAFDLVAEGLKIAGAAQRRTQNGLLHQGSIQHPGENLPSWEGLAMVFASDSGRRELSAREMESAQVLAAQKYATEAWLKKY